MMGENLLGEVDLRIRDDPFDVDVHWLGNAFDGDVDDGIAIGQPQQPARGGDGNDCRVG